MRRRGGARAAAARADRAVTQRAIRNLRARDPQGRIGGPGARRGFSQAKRRARAAAARRAAR